jgi:hypothetical protein
MSKEQATANVEEQLPLEEQQAPILKYTEEQAREIYNEGQRSGYIAAIKNIRANINDYLNDLIVAASMNQSKGE